MQIHTIARETRAYIALVIVAIASFGLPLYLYPSGASNYWAWTVAEPRTAMLIGSIYMVCTLYYGLLFVQKEWLLVRMSLQSLFVVASWLLIVAMFHWNSFYPWRAQTLCWIASYYLPLFFLPILFRLQRDRYGVASDVNGIRIAPAARAWFRIRAVIYAPVVVALLADTQRIRDAWPWTIELVNLRMLSGHVAVFGVFPAVVMMEGSWKRMKLFMIITAMMGTAYLILLNVPVGPFDGSAKLTVPFILMPVEWLVTSLAMLFIYRSREASHA